MCKSEKSDNAKKVSESRPLLWTPQQVRAASLDELRTDPCLWTAYERGWCDLVETYLSSQLMQTERNMTMLELWEEMRRNMGRAAATANGDQNVAAPNSSLVGGINDNGNGNGGDGPVVRATPKLRATSPTSAAARGRGERTANVGVQSVTYGARRTSGPSVGAVARRAVPPPLPLPPATFRLRRTAGPRAFASFDRGVERSVVRLENRTPPAESVDYVPSAAEFRVIKDDDDDDDDIV